jgi:hypothetical protein
MSQPGQYRGRRFSAYGDEIRALKRAGEHEELERLLLGLVDATEAESHARGGGVAPAYYLELAKLYRAQRRADDEVAVLERYAAQPHAPGVLPARLLERLAQARQRRAQR